MFWNAEIYYVTVVTQMGKASGRFKMLLVGKYMTVSIGNHWFINWYHEYHHLNEHKTVSAHTGLQMHTSNKQSLMAWIQRRCCSFPVAPSSFHYLLSNLQSLLVRYSLLSPSSSLLFLFFISSLSAHPFVCVFLSSAMQALQFFTSLGKQV